MPRQLLIVNVVLGLVVFGFGAYIGWELLRPLPAPTPARPRSANSTTSPAPVPAPAAQESGPGNWTTIASRNLFSPTRSDTGGPGAGVAIPMGPKPNLHGVVLRDGAPIAYLEDPATRRVAAYRVGDAVAGGILQSITATGVVLSRPEGQVDVRLHDPTKPRPPVPAQLQPAGATPPGAQAQPPAEGQPAPPLPAQVGPSTPQVPPPIRRPIPPSLIRRLPQTPGDAPTQ